ncbi:relaxase domain-containing protein [Pseudonocardia sp. MCCB 268]|nr:relaxase domain-containing protein [Pseudonocardia cytotoxica]
MAYLQDKAGYPGSDTTAARPAGGSTLTTGRLVLPARLARPRPAAAHPQHDPESGRGPDGTWRTLDGRSIYRWRPPPAQSPSAPGERLAHTLGMLVATRPDGKSREVVGVSEEAMGLISSRRRAVTAKTELFDAFELRYGRPPNSAERDRISRATFATRASKSHDGETREEFSTGSPPGCAPTSTAARPASLTPHSPPAARGPNRRRSTCRP